MHATSIPSEIAAFCGGVQPVSQGVGTVDTGWIAAKDFHSFLAVIQAGVLGAAATLDAKFQQATDNAGAGAKDVTGKSITQMVKATDDGKTSLLNLKTEELDVEGGFDFIRVRLTVGAAASLVGCAVMGFNPRFSPASDFDASTVKEVKN